MRHTNFIRFFPDRLYNLRKRITVPLAQKLRNQKTCLLSRQGLVHLGLDLTAYLLIPGFTILFVKGSNWFTTNFSVLGNGHGKENVFVFWGLSVGIYFFLILQMISGYLKPPPKSTFLIPLSLLLLLCAVTTPYLPEQMPFQSSLHVAFAFLSAVCLTIFLILLLWSLSKRLSLNLHAYRIGLSTIILISILLLLAAGIVSSALEIFYTVSVTLFCRRIERRLFLRFHSRL